MKSFPYLKSIKKFLLDILFPAKCTGCRTKNEILCDNCILKIRPAERETERDIIAVFDYRDPVIKKAIWELKYYHKRYLGEKMGQLLYESLIEEIADLKTEVAGRSIYVVPVPISKKKTHARGYNQALIIARGFCHFGEPGVLELKNNLVIKKIETTPQAKITNRKRRLQNVRGVFETINPDLIRGRTIIIIDDVTTTGGTISEIIKILKKAGAKKVIGFTVAH
ncbi:MAG: phosphoribosyltransferase family protein [Candidatus Paceibacterota bacterium]|jgi:ComF family protein